MLGIFLQLGSSLSRFVPSGGQISSMVAMFVWGTLLLSIVLVVGFALRQALKFRYRGEVYLMRQYDWETGIPQSKVLEGKAAYLKKKGRNFFRIRYGLMPWNYIDIRKLPNPKYMVGNKAYFLQYNVGELVQARKDINWTANKIVVEPVDNTTKEGAKMELGTYSQILNSSKITPQVVGMVVMGFILVTGIVVYYFLQKGF